SSTGGATLTMGAVYSATRSASDRGGSATIGSIASSSTGGSSASISSSANSSSTGSDSSSLARISPISGESAGSSTMGNSRGGKGSRPRTRISGSERLGSRKDRGSD